MLRNVSEASMTVFAPTADKANGVGVIVCPGGAWRVLAWDHEGIQMASWLAERGYTAFLLKYRVRGTPDDPAEFAAQITKWKSAMPPALSAADAPRSLAEAMPDEGVPQARAVAAEDGRRAIELIGERSVEFGISPDRIGMVGFSAGAFLVTDIALDPRGMPLAFAAPIYGGEVNGHLIPYDLPPLFTAVAQDDRAFFRIVENLYADWTNTDVPAELHVFARGGHGFGAGQRGNATDRWLDLLEGWLIDRGFA
jgi:acetyl esterase/lipase